jgi:hypothetical protein
MIDRADGKSLTSLSQALISPGAETCEKFCHHEYKKLRAMQ